MQQNQLIILVVLLVVVIIAVVAVAMMMGPQEPGVPTTQPPAGSNPFAPPASNTGPIAPPVTPPVGDASAIANAMASGAPVICTFDMNDGTQVGTATLKMEAPKMRMDASTQGEQVTMISPDGLIVYMYSQGQWYEFSADQSTVKMPDAAEIEYALENPEAGITYNCNAVGDIPDSEFQLPPGVTPVDFGDLMGGYDPNI
jgi:hypothetical protein